MPKVKGLFGFKLGDEKQEFTLHGDDLGAATSVSVVSHCEDGSTVEWKDVNPKPTGGGKKLKVKGKPVRTNKGKGPRAKDDVVGDMTVTVNFGGPTQTISFSNIAYE
jgi:hypothetical protein